VLLSLPEQVKYIQRKQMLLVSAQILATIEYAIYLFATCWKVRGSNDGGREIFRNRSGGP